MLIFHLDVSVGALRLRGSFRALNSGFLGSIKALTGKVNF
jgi:hypothetical protein